MTDPLEISSEEPAGLEALMARADGTDSDTIEATEPPKASKSTTRALTRRGILRAKSGDLAGAIEDYSEALQFADDHLPALANRGVAHFHSGNFDAADVDCSKALRIAPKLAKAWLVRGLARAKVGLDREAEEDLLRYVDLAPSSNYIGVVRKTLRELERKSA
ncbi:MAG: tetratricopeptide repeat protein [Planctomycetes bacterium]|nr:tetratricopeptide repeat protein [Planctomycetota bacterium]